MKFIYNFDDTIIAGFDHISSFFKLHNSYAGAMHLDEIKHHPEENQS